MSLRLLIALAAALIASAYFFTSGDNSSTLQQHLSTVRDISKKLTRLPPQVSTVYKWQNAEGEWHFSSSPPASDTRYEKQTYRSDSNVIPAPPTSQAQASTATTSTTPARTTPETATLPGLTSLDKATKIIDDARALQDLNDNRIDTINQQINASQ